MFSENIVPTTINLQVLSKIEVSLLPFRVLIWVDLDLNRYIRHVVHVGEKWLLSTLEQRKILRENKKTPSNLYRFVVAYVDGGVSKASEYLVSLRPNSCCATCG